MRYIIHAIIELSETDRRNNVLLQIESTLWHSHRSFWHRRKQVLTQLTQTYTDYLLVCKTADFSLIQPGRFIIEIRILVHPLNVVIFFLTPCRKIWTNQDGLRIKTVQSHFTWPTHTIQPIDGERTL
ncbi:MAG: hypothetical protein IGNPGNKH_00229 [Sodalis sp. Ffu]|nr:MAG: hypothetical protein IGNPGNKH_00229 [Sodalis sp. Ffu]